MKALALAISVCLAGTALAEGPGSQLRATPEIPQATPMPTNPVRPDAKRCETLAAQQRQQCLADLRATPTPTPRPHGPESIGGGAGAATGASSGTTGGATFGGSAPR